jgi:dTDP-4-amino-4,6-dideoxygalactose transaminase
MKIDVYSPTIRRKEMDAVLTSLVEDKIGPGEGTKLLVQIAREHLGFDYCLALRSPVLALFFALKSLNIEEGKGVVISSLSPRYYVRVIEDLKLKPVYCDVSPASAVMGRETVENVLKPGEDPRCVVLHHTLGFVPDSAGIAELGLPVIEDCSHSFGSAPAAEENAENAAGEGGRGPAGRVPVLGSAGVFCILGLEERDMLTAGGGALLYAMNRRDASVLRNLGDLSAEYTLPDMNAAMAVVQFKEAAKNIQKRKLIAQKYVQAALRIRHKRCGTG